MEEFVVNLGFFNVFSDTPLKKDLLTVQIQSHLTSLYGRLVISAENKHPQYTAHDEIYIHFLSPVISGSL